MRNRKLRKKLMISNLAAIAAILALLKISYPLVPYLEFDLSETIVLVTALFFNVPAIIFVSFFKSIVHMLNGPSGPYYIGEITALIAALAYGFSFYFIKDTQIMRKLITVSLIATLILTVANFLFITPIYFGHFSFLSLIENTEYTYTSYLYFIIITYIPFNLLKAASISTVFYLLHPALLKIKGRLDEN